MTGAGGPPAVAVVEDFWGPAFDDLAREMPVLADPDGWSRPAELPALLDGVRALVVRNRTGVDRSLLAACPSLLVVGRAGVGLDNIDLAAADELGVVVTAARGANAVSVAEHTIGLALAVARRTAALDRGVRRGRWDRSPGRELGGRTWGLVGFGATGRAVARLARALGMSVLAHDPFVTADHPEAVRLAPLEEVAGAADVLSIHAPAGPATHHLVDAALLELMRPDAILVNVGRGELVDEAALAAALAGGRLLGAGLDVRATEPPEPGPLDGLENVVFTPHIAGITTESQHRISLVLADDIRAVLGGAAARSAVGIARPGRGRP